MTDGAFRMFAETLLDRGYSPLPVIPGQKKPALREWSNFCAEPLPRPRIRSYGARRPRASLGVALGYAGVVALDVDTEDASQLAAIREAVPPSPVAKTGAKGFTAFYRTAPGVSIPSRHYTASRKCGIADLLSIGTQTVLPPSPHPAGHAYRWLTPDTLLTVPACDLPKAPADIAERLETALAPWMPQPRFEGAHTLRACPPEGHELRRLTAFAKSGLARRARDLASTAEGSRNNTLFALGAGLGRFVFHGVLPAALSRRPLSPRVRQTGCFVKTAGWRCWQRCTKGWRAPRTMCCRNSQIGGPRHAHERSRRIRRRRNRRAANRDSQQWRYRLAGADRERRGQGPLSTERRGVSEPRWRVAGLERDDLSHCRPPRGQEIPLTDEVAEALWLEAERAGLPSRQPHFIAVLGDIARRRAFHPIRDYLDSLEWDGIGRLDTWLTLLGAEDTELNRAYGRKTLIGAVRRVRQPGAKHDTILVLQGPQGKGKSSAIRALCPNEDYFSDSLGIGDAQKEVIEATTGKWLIELAELSGMGKRDANAVKSMLSRMVDAARLSYGKLSTERPRQFVLFGSVNEEQYLRDPTGNRRFWPVTISGQLDPDEMRGHIERTRDRLWAEAAYFEALGESSTLPKHSVGDGGRKPARTPDRRSLARALGGGAGGQDVYRQCRCLRSPGRCDRPAQYRHISAHRGHSRRHGVPPCAAAAGRRQTVLGL